MLIFSWWTIAPDSSYHYQCTNRWQGTSWPDWFTMYAPTRVEIRSTGMVSNFLPARALMIGTSTKMLSPSGVNFSSTSTRQLERSSSRRRFFCTGADWIGLFPAPFLLVLKVLVGGFLRRNPSWNVLNSSFDPYCFTTASGISKVTICPSTWG